MAKKIVEEEVQQREEEAMPIFKFFLVENPPIHAYTRAALQVSYQGMMKTVVAWNEELKNYMSK